MLVLLVPGVGMKGGPAVAPVIPPGRLLYGRAALDTRPNRRAGPDTARRLRAGQDTTPNLRASQ